LKWTYIFFESVRGIENEKQRNTNGPHVEILCGCNS
jgi:hypothetical protein